jgi:hypothetical protein
MDKNKIRSVSFNRGNFRHYFETKGEAKRERNGVQVRQVAYGFRHLQIRKGWYVYLTNPFPLISKSSPSKLEAKKMLKYFGGKSQVFDKNFCFSLYWKRKKELSYTV